MTKERNKILVIDDEIEMLNIIEGYLELEDFIIFKETDGLSGLETLKKINPDIILLDMMMPTLDGIEFLEYLEANNINYPIIAVTGADESVLKTIRDLGVTTILRKPFNDEELLNSINLKLTNS